jgi:hypothetical protein
MNITLLGFLLIGAIVVLPLIALMSFWYLLTVVAKDEQQYPDKYDIF